jgi:hypothetical protein
VKNRKARHLLEKRHEEGNVVVIREGAHEPECRRRSRRKAARIRGRQIERLGSDGVGKLHRLTDGV